MYWNFWSRSDPFNVFCSIAVDSRQRPTTAGFLLRRDQTLLASSGRFVGGRLLTIMKRKVGGVDVAALGVLGVTCVTLARG
jgi:hypothetical protein